MLAWLLFNALVATALLAVETHKARRKVRWLLDQPLSFWEWRDRNRRMMESAMKAIGKLQEFPKARFIAAPAGDTVTFRRPPAFKERA